MTYFSASPEIRSDYVPDSWIERPLDEQDDPELEYQRADELIDASEDFD